MRISLTALFLMGQIGAGACSAQTIYDFLGKPSAANPLAGLVLGKGGVLYGTSLSGGASNFGAVYALAPPSSGHTDWTETNLYFFQGQPDGRQPRAGLYAAADGSLYGTTSDGGTANPGFCNFYAGCGTFFRLIPPAAGKTAWSEQVLYEFDGTDSGYFPASIPLPDGSGGFYLTVSQSAAGGGTIMHLTPPATGTAWTGTVLYAFPGFAYPGYRLAIDGNGKLYGTTQMGGRGFGTIFRLTPPAVPGGGWQFTTLHVFDLDTEGSSPVAGVTIGPNGTLFGTASSGGPKHYGTVFKLTPPRPSMPSVFTVLHAFAGTPDDGAYPEGGVLLDHQGNIFGTTEFGAAYIGYPCSTLGCGTVYQLSPPDWQETFVSQTNGGYEYLGDLARGQDQALYGTSYLGGDGGGYDGTVYRIPLSYRASAAPRH